MKYLKLMRDILAGKKIGDENNSVTAITYASFLNWIYKLLALCVLTFGVGSIIYIVRNINTTVLDIPLLLIMIIVVIICFLFFFVFWAMGNEIKDEPDKDKVLSELTTVATIIALIIAALSLKH